MVLKYVEVVIQLSSIGLVIAAAGLWAGAEVDTRPRFRDEQTLVGGTIWSQIIIPIGLMITKIVEEYIDDFVQGFYLVSGIFLLWVTGAVLIIHEIKCQRRSRRNTRNSAAPLDMIPHGHHGHHGRGHLLAAATEQNSDKVYYAIGIVCFIAGLMKLLEFIVILTN